MLRRMLIVALVVAWAASVGAEESRSVRVVKDAPDALRGRVVVTVDGVDRTIAEDAWNAWLVESRRAVVYSGTDGAGGYENEGQSLWRYALRTGRRQKLMAEQFLIQEVVDARARSGRTALLVAMTDGGLGAPHVAVVDPRRGQVWRHRGARFGAVRNGHVTVRIYRIADFGGDEPPLPRQVLCLDLDDLLRRPASSVAPVRSR